LDPYIHLTNNAITKFCPEVAGGNYDATMWHSEQYKEYLEETKSPFDFASVLAQMKKLSWIAFHTRSSLM
jgi:hypothetical protein